MGSINLKHTGSGSAIALSSDGTSLLLDGTAIGGGGSLDLYAETYDGTSTKPSVSGGTNSISIGQNSESSGNKSIALGAYSVASGLQSTAVGYICAASGTADYAAGTGGSAYGGYGVAISGVSSASKGVAIGLHSGHSKARATGVSAVALNGSRASGVDSFAVSVANDSTSYGASGANSIAIGYQAKAINVYSTSIGSSNNVTGYGGFGAGDANIVSGDFGVAIGRGNTSGATVSSRPNVALGYTNIATGGVALAVGGNSDTQGIWGKMAHAGGRFSVNGDAQNGRFVLRSDTTDATAEAMTTNNSTASTNNQIVLPNNSAYAFHGTIVARQRASEGTASAAWKVEGLIRREGSAGTTVLVNSATTVLDNTPSWGMTLSADTTNGALKIEVTGASATNIRWVATINTSELTYA